MRGENPLASLEGKGKGVRIAPGVCARGAATHSSSPWPPALAAPPPFRFTFLLVSSQSLSGTPPPWRQRGEGSLFPCFFGSSSRVNQRLLFFASFVVVVYFFFPFLTAPVSAANSAQVSWGSIYQKDIEPDHGAEDYGRSCYYYLQISPG